MNKYDLTKETYSTPAAVIECDLRKEIMLLKMQLSEARKEIENAHKTLDATRVCLERAPLHKLDDRIHSWLDGWRKELDEFKAEQKAVIEEWKGKR